jgi:ferrochelatase
MRNLLAQTLAKRPVQVMKKFAVIISSHGEVEEPNFAAYRSQIQHIFHHASLYMQIPKLAQQVIPTVGGALMTLKYKRTKYRSPHNRIARLQAEKIQTYLARMSKATSAHFEVMATFETTPPYTEAQLQEAVKRYDGIIVLTMNPINGDLSCGTLCRFAQQTFPEKDLSKFAFIGGLWQDYLLAEVYRDYVFSQVKGVKLQGKVGLILIMHGTVVAQKNGEPVSFRNGLKETESFYEQLSTLLKTTPACPFSDVTVAYLNHAVGGKWTSPSMSEAIAQLKARGVETAVAFASGYFAESSETHHAAEHLHRAGFKNAYYIPCVNDWDMFVEYLAGRVHRAAEGLLKRQDMLR